MKNIFKYSYLVAVAACILVATSCDDGSDKLTGVVPEGTIQDISSSSDIAFVQPRTGAGALLNFTASEASEILHVIVDGTIVASEFSVADGAGSFRVPISLELGVHDFQFVHQSQRSVMRQIEVVPLPGITYFTPRSASQGDVVTVLGVNFDKVSGVNIGGVDATINSQDAGSITFTVPAGISTNAINLTSDELGSESLSQTDLVSCDSEASHLLCLPLINTNGSFEDSALGAADGVAGWGGLNGALASGEITDEEAFDGSQSVKMEILGLGANPWNIQPTSNVDLDPTGTYHMSIWVKGNGIANFKFAMDEAGTPGWSEWGNPEVSISGDVWTEISYEFSPASESAGGDNVGRLAISMSYDGNVGGVFYMDALRIVRVD